MSSAPLAAAGEPARIRRPRRDAAPATSAAPIRVLFVSQYFPPETGAAPARAHHFARALAAAGHSVRVITGMPNHPSGVLQPDYVGLRRAVEARDGVTVERVWLHATPRKTAWTRLWNHLTFAWSALGVALRGPRPDVVLASVPPPFLGLTAWLAACRHRVPLVLDCRDDWPAAAVALGEMRPGLATSLLGALSRFLQKRAARVIAVTPGMLRQFETRGLDLGRLALVTNGADTERFTPEPGGTNGSPAGADDGADPASDNGSHPFTVLYAGTHGLVHGMEVVLEAARLLADRRDVRFVLVGDGVAKPALQAGAEAMGLETLEFRPSEPPERLVETIRAADACLATTRADAFCGETIPVKLFDYLACGKPVIAAVRGDAAQVVEESGGGVIVEPGDARALAEAIAGLASDPDRCARLGRAGPAFVEANYSRRATGAALVRLLAEVVDRAQGHPVAPRPSGVYAVVRRAIDIAVAGLLLLVLSPALAVIAIAIRLDSKGPALFHQRRIGRGSAEFTILKFRTMRVGTPDLASHLVGPGSDRVTPVGRHLRRSSLDELPQLWNVLMGEMSLIGPRPALFNQDDLIAERRAAGIDALKPGVTGWAQIHGRDDIPLETKVALDRHYLENVSPMLDLWIVLRTVVILFSDRGVY